MMRDWFQNQKGRAGSSSRRDLFNGLKGQGPSCPGGGRWSASTSTQKGPPSFSKGTTKSFRDRKGPVPKVPLWVMWTAPWQELCDVAAALVGCGHVSGLFVRPYGRWP